MHKQGEMVLIPVPFSDLKSKRRRPVIIISNDLYNQKTEDIVVVAVTSNLEKKTTPFQSPRMIWKRALCPKRVW